MTAAAPLAGVRIVEIDAIGTVAFAGMLLADLGCDIVRVVEPDARTSEVVPALYRGREEIQLDFRHPATIAEVASLAEQADGLIEGRAPRSMEALGLGPERLCTANPRLVYGRATAWGQRGPMAGRPGTDINVLALSGALHAIGSVDQPAVPLNLLGDQAGGVFLALGMVSAILAARTSGVGRVVDAAAFDGVGALLGLTQSLFAAGRWLDRRGANLVDGGAPFYRSYACRDGGHIAVGALDPVEFGRLCAGLGFAPDRFAQFDRTGWAAMAAAFTERFASRSRAEWAFVFADGAACVTPVLTLAEAARTPHALARRPIAGGPSGGALAPQFDPAAPSAHAARSTTVDAVLTRWRN